MRSDRGKAGGVVLSRWLAAAALGLLGGGPLGAQTEVQYTWARQKLVEEAVAQAGVKDPRVLQAMRDTPRHEFVPTEQRELAYYDMALPIGEDQTISSPYIVACMTESLEPQPTDRVLEIGTGSGYQAAVLSPLVKEVYSIEIVEPLGRKAARTLARLGYRNVFTKVGDGFQGWAEHAPFDKIIVTCSPEDIPQPLVDQLREGGVMVIPAGERYQQTLWRLRKQGGQLQREALQPTLFVPMTGVAETQRRVQPDAANPQVVNGTFEEPPGADGFVPGWYYHRQVTWHEDAAAPQGAHYIVIRNETPGRAGQLLQGLALDGRLIAEIQLSAQVRCRNVRQGRAAVEVPFLGLTFYDGERRDLGLAIVGPLLGDRDWQQVSKSVRVPPQTRAALVRVGLFGAVGELAVDDVQISAQRR